MRAVVAIAFYLLYWGICVLSTGTDRKNLIGLRSYPDAVQARVRREPGLAAPPEKSMPAILLSNLALFTIVFSLLGLALKRPLGLNGYGAAFGYFLLLGEGLGLFDLVVIDLLWWRNSKRVRFSFLPEKEASQDPGKHIGSVVRGIPLFAAAAALAAGAAALL